MTTKRILIFLAFAFGIPWATALVLYLTSGKETGAATIGLVNTIFILSPGAANIITRLITREGWKNTWLRPNFQRGWRFYLAAWLLPLLAVIVGAAIFFLLFPQTFDPTLSQIRSMQVSQPSLAGMQPWMILALLLVQILFIGLTINAVASIGEEFGWRAYLLQKLVERFTKDETATFPAPRKMTSGAFKAAALVGVIWGVWHWPLLLMSYAYGLVQPSSPPLDPLVYLVFTTAVSVLLSWATLRSGSVWPAAVGHGMNNSTSVLPAYLSTGANYPLLGPLPTGLISALGYVALALALFISRKRGVVPSESPSYQASRE